MLGFIGELFEAGADLIGGAAQAVGGVFGGGSGGGGLFGSIFGGDGGRGILGLGMDIFGGGDSGDGGWGIFDSPVAGHILGAVGTELMRGDPVKEHARMYAAQREAERKAIRANYGLDGHGPTPVVYTPPYSPAGAM